MSLLACNHGARPDAGFHDTSDPVWCQDTIFSPRKAMDILREPSTLNRRSLNE